MGIADSIAAASMSMSRLQFETAYDTAMVKKSMDAMEQQAMAFVEMMDSIPAPRQYNFDVYAWWGMQKAEVHLHLRFLFYE